MKKNISWVKANWEEFAKKDPLWSILPIPEKKNGRWEMEELFKTGQEEICSVMEYMNRLNLKIKNQLALDFGCGVGRLTQALCKFFDNCIGVDISFQMLRIAAQNNRHKENCTYILNCAPDLKIFKDNVFDFIYSNIVFQHLPPQLTVAYIKEFIRILKKNGIIIFQATTGIIGLQNKIRRTLNFILPVFVRHLYKQIRFKTWAIKDMYCIKEEVLNNIIISNGAKIIDVIDDGSSLPRYQGKRYCITK
ncbi:MAG: class I SAM-dependent methyltransferase [bacterium]